jgi:hypothetical protein
VPSAGRSPAALAARGHAVTQLSVVREEDARLAAAQATAIYGSTAGSRPR